MSALNYFNKFLRIRTRELGQEHLETLLARFFREYCQLFQAVVSRSDKESFPKLSLTQIESIKAINNGVLTQLGVVMSHLADLVQAFCAFEDIESVLKRSLEVHELLWNNQISLSVAELKVTLVHICCLRICRGVFLDERT